MTDTAPGGTPNAFERDKPGTADRFRSEARIEDLRRQGGVFVEAVRATRMPMVLTDPALPGNPIVFANQSFLKLSGYSLDEVLGQQPHFMNGPGTDPQDAERFRKALEQHRDEVVETVQYRKDGSRFVATVLLSVFRDHQGRTLHHFLSWCDVTRRVDAEDAVAALRKAQAALQESEGKYRSLFESIDEGFCVIEVLFDADGRPADYVFLETNASFERQTGLIDAVGRRMRDLAPEHEQHWFDIYGRIAMTGEPQRFEQPAEALGRWYDVYAFRIGDPEQRHVAILFNDIAERKHAERALRESEERQRFLLAVGDAMRVQSTAGGKIEVAARHLGERLGASRVLYGEYDWEKNLAHIFNGWFADGALPFPTVMQLEGYEGEVLNDLRAGRTVRVDNVGLLVEEPAYAAIADLGVQALLSVPLIVGGRLKVNVSVHQHEPRHWTDEEVALVQEVSERLWAEVVRARAEATLRDSEERFRDFGEASQDVLWMRDAGTLQWVYLSAAFERIYGASREEALSGPTLRNWLALILPEDREHALDHIRKVRAGERVTFEYRIRRPADGAVRWLRDTDFPIHDEAGEVVRIGGIGQDITALKEAERHQQVLLAELQHRVRNTLGVVRSIARRTAERSATVEDMFSHFQGRLDAFSRVQAIVTRNPEAGVELESLIEDELLAHAAREGEALIVEGPEVSLKARAAESLSLAIHELATNAVKYGALSAERGRIAVRWERVKPDGTELLHLAWEEHGVDMPPGPPARQGFGLELLQRSLPYDLRAETRVDFRPGGLRFEMTMPLGPDVLAN